MVVPVVPTLYILHMANAVLCVSSTSMHINSNTHSLHYLSMVNDFNVL